ncbi:hypothetical protein WJ968_21345 [Achromobacter xylosoxidans]
MDTTELTADLVGLPGSVLHITVTAPFSQAPQAECVWTLESEALSAQTFRVLAVKRKEGLVAEISAIQHEPGKFDNVDFGTRLDPKPITVVPPSVQAAPQNIRLASRSVIDQGIARHVAEISWASCAVRRGLPRAMAPRQFRLGRGRSHRLADAGTARHPRRRLRGAGARHQRRRRVFGLGQLDRDPAPGRPGAAARAGPAGHAIAGVRHRPALGLSGRALHRAAHRDLVRPDQ